MIQPTGNNILIRKPERRQKQKGMIRTPDLVRKNVLICEVITVGRGYVLKNGEVAKTIVQPGNKVYLSPLVGSDINVDDDEYTIMPEADVMMVDFGEGPKPLSDRLLVEPLKEDEKTGGEHGISIILAETARVKSQIGNVMLVGPGRLTSTGERHGLSVKPTDHVVYGKGSGFEIYLYGKDLLLMRECEIHAALEEV